jgi:glycosyltransferase involved in cell wall biosynthesis
LIEQDDKSKVISLGKRFAERMTEDYELSFKEEDYLQNGLCFEKYKNFLDRKFSNQDLLNFGIDIKAGGKIIFSWGRCSIAKGFKELANAWARCYDKLPEHNLILQMPNNSGESNYFLEAKTILNNLPRTNIIDDFNPDIWKTVLRNTNTEVVCVPSLMDPFPHTSIEAKLFSDNMNYVTVISDVDGAVDAFHVKEAFHVDPRNTELFAEKIIKAATMENQERKKMIDKNTETIERFNFPKIFEKFMVNNIQS